MYKLCKTEQSSQRQRQLEQGLLLAMKNKRYEEVTISDLCEQMQIPRKSFYRYFDSKEGCLFALLDHTIMTGASYYMPEGSLDLSGIDFCIRICEYWQNQTQLLNALEKNSLSLQLLQRIVRYALTEESAYTRYLGIPQDHVMEHIVYNVGGLMGLILTWHHEGYQKTAAQMGQILYQLTQHK